MQAIWTNDEAEYHGEFVNFEPIWQWPKPVQKPHPPILVGGDSPRTLQRVVRYGDAWMPVGRRTDFKSRIAELNRLAAAAGRQPIPVTIFGATPRPEVIASYAEAGVERVVFTLPPAPASEVLPILTRHAELARSFA
jgi:alkanesulfonate monooxygenase SsuD/methylene tetrahydromethanopterin reductase-like flavin-dependent oxidoreductase (luciferase family)